MSVDWFTVGAQALNLLILLLLMRLFLFKPILKAVDEREKSIALKISKAEEDGVLADKIKAEFEDKNRELALRKEALIKSARDETDAVRERLLGEIRNEVADSRLKRKESLELEEIVYRDTVVKKLQEETLALTRRVLLDLAERDLEEQIAKALIVRLRNMDFALEQDLKAALEKSSNVITIRSASLENKTNEAMLEKVVKEMLGSQVSVRFEEYPDLICGLELRVQGLKVAWNIADYLASVYVDTEEASREASR